MTDGRLDRICIVMMSAVGDTVHVLPLVNAIKRQHPSSHITWVLQPGPATLVRGHPAVDEVIVFDRSKGLRAFREVISELRARDFDVLINLQAYLKAGIITALSGTRRRIGFDRARAPDANWLFTTERIPARGERHVQEQYFEFLEQLGVEPEPAEWRLGPWDTEREWQREFMSQFDRPIAAVVVAASNAARDWAPERIAEVCDILSEQYDVQPVLVGGDSPKERDVVARIMSRTRSKPVSMLGSGLRKLVSILDASALVISPDTGPLHISVALNKPVIALMGVTDSRRTGPWRHFDDLIVDTFNDPDEPAPISKKRVSAAKSGDGMARISVADVVKKLEIWNKRYRGKS